MTIDLLTSDEQDEIIASVRSFLTEEPSLRTRQRWIQCAELGWFGLGLPESLGGVGYGLAEEALLMREVGRQLASGPVLASIIGARAAALAGDQALAQSILGGNTTVAMSIPIGGVQRLVFDGDIADALLALDDHSASIFDMSQLTERASLGCIDETTTLTEGVVTGAPRCTATGTDLWSRALVLAAGALVGMSEQGRDLSVAHAGNRVQFGHPIGVNQAIKHPCADMATRCEGALAQLCFAALSVGSEEANARFEALSALVFATETAIYCGRTTVQIHGGMGFTVEHPAHLIVKRTHVIDRMFGGLRSHLASLVALPSPDR
ncbi:MAG: acyl-CoA dehydrogenase family protein [Acidimicrobiia bacterium]